MEELKKFNDSANSQLVDKMIGQLAIFEKETSDEFTSEVIARALGLFIQEELRGELPWKEFVSLIEGTFENFAGKFYTYCIAVKSFYRL